MQRRTEVTAIVSAMHTSFEHATAAADANAAATRKAEEPIFAFTQRLLEISSSAMATYPMH